jgi:PAS domain S-box-containing protein
MIEHEILTNAFEATPVPVFVVDAELRIVFVNRAAREASASAGIDNKKLVGNYLFDILTFLPSNIRETYELVLRTGEAVAEEATYVVADKPICVEIIRYPILRQERITHVGVCFKDITELRRTQEALRISEGTTRALMNASTESMFLIDENEIIIAANAISAERLEIPVLELEGKTFNKAMGIVPGDTKNERMDYFRKVKKTGKPLRFTDERKGRIFDVSMFPVTDPQDVARRVAVFARDVTEAESMIKALGESEKRCRDLFQHIPVPTFVFQWNGTDFILQKANAASNDLTGDRISSLLGQTATKLYSENTPWIIDNLKKCLSTKGRLVQEMQYTMQTTGEIKFFQAHYVFVAPDEVLVHALDLTERHMAELARQNFYSELEQRVVDRTRELADANKQLHVEREALNQKNAALRELIGQITNSKETLASSIQTNLQRVTIPILERLGSKLDEPGRNYLKMLRDSLDNILSPHLAGLQKQHPYLTAHEIDLCNLIKSGFTSKEIAEMRGRSDQTILKQRTLIRKKLGLTDEKINLRNYLASVELESSTK